MSKQKLTGTWIENDLPEAKRETVLQSGERAVVQRELASKTGWQHFGRMEAYGDAIVGGPMHLTSLENGEDLSVGPIASVSAEDKRVIVKTADETLSLEIERETPKIQRYQHTNLIAGFGQMIRDAFRY